MVECALHMHVRDYDSPEFRDEIPFKEGNSNLRKKGKIVNLVINPKFIL